MHNVDCIQLYMLVQNISTEMQGPIYILAVKPTTKDPKPACLRLPR